MAVLGRVLGWALSEHNARLANVESDIRNIAEAQARTEGEIKAISIARAEFASTPSRAGTVRFGPAVSKRDDAETG